MLFDVTRAAPLILRSHNKGHAMSKLPYFPFYVSDFKGATDYLDPEDVGLYIRMLCLLWESPTCSFPNDFNLIKRKLILRNNNHDEKLRYILKEFFTVKRGKYIQKRLMQEYVNAKDTFKKHSSAGIAGAKAKALKKKEKLSSNEQAMNKQRLSNEQASIPITKSIPINKKEPPLVPQGGKRKSQWPNDFIPSKEVAEKYWLDRDREDLNYSDEVAAFKDWCLANGKKYLDWEAAWRTRYCNAVKFNKKPTNGFDKPKVISAEELEEMIK